MSETTNNTKPKAKKTSRRLRSGLLIVISVIILVSAGYIITNNLRGAVQGTENFSQSTTDNIFVDEPSKSTKLAKFSGQEFRDLYNSFAYPNTAFISEDAIIFSNQTVDSHVQKIAEMRGYERRSAPVLDTFVEVQKAIFLQERAAQPWEDLKNAAKKDGIELFLTAGYRSADEQREIFINRLSEINLTEDLIATKKFDDKLNEVLSTTAIPGYSRHHTGYTIDIGCGNTPEVEFEFTECFQWLSKANYNNAKIHGFIPSYPEDGGLQGPEPETWEYVWVGLEALYE